MYGIELVDLLSDGRGPRICLGVRLAGAKNPHIVPCFGGI